MKPENKRYITHRGKEIRISEGTMQTGWRRDYVYLYDILEKAKF